MSPLFRAIGALVALYTLYAVVKGAVYARSGMKGGIVSRRERPGYFWTLIAVYAGLSIAMVTVF
jgi:hypothetical protein